MLDLDFTPDGLVLRSVDAGGHVVTLDVGGDVQNTGELGVYSLSAEGLDPARDVIGFAVGEQRWSNLRVACNRCTVPAGAGKAFRFSLSW